MTDIISPRTRPSPRRCWTPRRRSSVGRGPAAPAKKRLGLFFWICAGWIGLIILVAIFANLLPLPNPDFQNFAAPQNAGPAWGHLLGTDDLNRDIFSRLLFGARVSLVVGFGGTAIGLILGGIPAMFSAYRRGRVDTFLNTISYAVLAFPALVAVIAIGSFWGHQLWKITLVIGVFSAPAHLPGRPGLDAVLRHPGLRHGGQGPGGERPAHSGP